MPCSPSQRITHGVARCAWRRIVPLWQHHCTRLLPRHPPARTNINWLAALDVLNAGDNLPYQTSGKDTTSDFTGSIDDWRIAIAWGRMLIALGCAVGGNNTSSVYPSHPSRHPNGHPRPRTHKQVTFPTTHRPSMQSAPAHVWPDPFAGGRHRVRDAPRKLQ